MGLMWSREPIKTALWLNGMMHFRNGTFSLADAAFLCAVCVSAIRSSRLVVPVFPLLPCSLHLRDGKAQKFPFALAGLRTLKMSVKGERQYASSPSLYRPPATMATRGRPPVKGNGLLVLRLITRKPLPLQRAAGTTRTRCLCGLGQRRWARSPAHAT